MIKCSCCGKSISEEAKLCPHCGQPTEYKKENDKHTGNVIFWIIVVVVLCAIIG